MAQRPLVRGKKEALDDVWQRVAWNALQDLLAGCGVRPGAAADVDGDRVDRLSIDRRAQSAEADVGRLVIAASRLATGPVHGERRAVGSEAPLERLRERERGPFGV